MACVHVSGLGCFRLLGMLLIAYGKKISAAQLRHPNGKIASSVL
jgi:hypothetical protein